MPKDSMITKSKLKSEYGFTDKLIKEFLPEPDETAVNPIRKRAAPMQLYKVSRIKKVMKTKKFKKAFEESSIRKESAKKAVKTKTDKTIKMIQKKISKIKVTKLDVSDEELQDMAIHSYASHRANISMYYGNCVCLEEIVADAYGADSDTINRWTVNFIRHELTKYDPDLYSIRGNVGKHAAYLMYRKAVLNEIAKVYPNYKKECDKQINVEVSY